MRTVFRVLIIFIAVFVLFAIAFFSWYIGVFDQRFTSERVRFTIDDQLKTRYDKKNIASVWLNRFVFHNADKYVWRPPRIIVMPSDNGSGNFFEVSGMVTNWDPATRILSLNSYIGKELSVLFDPEMNETIAVLAAMDKYGVIEDVNSIQIINRSTIPNWDTLFCPSDIVVVQVKQRSSITKSTQASPLVPANIRLTHRLCGT